MKAQSKNELRKIMSDQSDYVLELESEIETLNREKSELINSLKLMGRQIDERMNALAKIETAINNHEPVDALWEDYHKRFPRP